MSSDKKKLKAKLQWCHWEWVAEQKVWQQWSWQICLSTAGIIGDVLLLLTRSHARRNHLMAGCFDSHWPGHTLVTRVRWTWCYLSYLSAICQPQPPVIINISHNKDVSISVSIKLEYKVVQSINGKNQGLGFEFDKRYQGLVMASCVSLGNST